MGNKTGELGKREIESKCTLPSGCKKSVMEAPAQTKGDMVNEEHSSIYSPISAGSSSALNPNEALYAASHPPALEDLERETLL